MNRVNIVLKYTLFAIASTGINLFFQWITMIVISHQFNLYISILSGTGSGLLTKYYLDKKYIFYYYVKNITKDIEKFLIYSIMGIVTTLIFWGFELSFYYYISFENAKYIGAIIGLAIGYIMKYFLDKKYVFTK